MRFKYDAMGNRIEKIHYNLGSGKTTHTFYVNDAQGNTMSIYEWINKDSLYLAEQLVYGSNRMGMYKIDTLIHSTASGNISNSPSGNFFIGRKRYELTNHLGNVMATVTDRKLNTTGGNGLGPEIKNVYDYYAFGSHEPNRVFAKQRCATDYDTTLGSPIDSDSFDDVSISGSTAYSNFTWEIFGTAGFNENCNNSNDFPDLVLCSNNLGGVETSFNGYTAGEVYHLQFDFFAWESTDCYYIDGSGCVDGSGVTIEIYDSSLALTHTQTLSTGTAQGFYFTAPSTSFKLRISYSNYYSSWKRCCLLIDNVILSQTTINSNTVCFKDKYRYGFNGKEKINEIYGEGNAYDLGARMYSSRLGKMFSPDPKEIEYPWQSTYAYYANSPIWIIDMNGEGDPLETMQVRGNRASNLQGMVRNGGSRPHQGFDLTAAPGTPVLAVKDATVHSTGFSQSYGNFVVLSITDADGIVTYAYYAHLQTISVSAKQQVTEGQQIGEAGQTGNAKGQALSEAHLHFEYRSEPTPGLGLGGRLDPNEILDTKFYSQDPDGNQTNTGVIKEDADGTLTKMNRDGSSETIYASPPPSLDSSLEGNNGEQQ